MKMEITETNFCTALLEAVDPEKKMLDIVDRNSNLDSKHLHFLSED